jgi:Transglycosylase SLT domain
VDLSTSFQLPGDFSWLGESPREASIAKLPGIGRLSEGDLAALFRAAEELKVSPDGLASIISQESGFRPAIQNPNTNATGLIQFIPSTAKALGTTVEALKGMTFQQQLPFVIKFYKGSRCLGFSVGRLYLCTFCPAVMDQPDEVIIARKDLDEKGPCGNQAKVYAQNIGLDLEKDGLITVGDVRLSVERRLDLVRERVRFNPDTPPESTDGAGSSGWSPLKLTAIGGALYLGGKLLGWFP